METGGIVIVAVISLAFVVILGILITVLVKEIHNYSRGRNGVIDAPANGSLLIDRQNTMSRIRTPSWIWFLVFGFMLFVPEIVKLSLYNSELDLSIEDIFIAPIICLSLWYHNPSGISYSIQG